MGGDCTHDDLQIEERDGPKADVMKPFWGTFRCPDCGAGWGFEGQPE